MKIKESGFKKINSGKRLPVLTIHVAPSPATSCIQTLPLEMKQLVREQYDNFKDWLINEDLPDHVRAGAMAILNNIVNYMMKQDKSEKWDWFCTYTKQLDKLRNQSIVDIVPYYSQYFVDNQ